MPNASDMEILLARILCYGPAKSRKTWWALKAAEQGFNVIVIDGDDGLHILKQIKPEIRSRISVINAVDKFNEPVFSDFMVRLLKGYKLVWDEDAKRSALQINKEHSHAVIEPMKFTSDDVLVIDSWTALVKSLTLRFAIEQQIDLADAEKLEWDGYGYTGRLADWYLTNISALPCHVIVIGHAQDWEKKKQFRNSQGKWEFETIFTRRQPISTSGPTGANLAKYFSDVPYFFLQGDSGFAKIDTSGGENRVGGCRSIAPKVYNWDDLNFIDFVKAINKNAPKELKPTEGIKFFPPGVDPNAKNISATPNSPKKEASVEAEPAPILQAQSAQTAQLATSKQLANLFKKG